MGHPYYDAKRAEQRAARTFEAKYHGTCPACGEHITPDDQCRYDLADVVVHADCSEHIADEPTTETCGRCFMAVAVNGTCGCDD